MKSLRQRVGIPLLATLVMGIVGALLGYLMGGLITLRETSDRLSNDATTALQDSVAYSTDAHAILNAMRATPATPCSEADLAFLQEQLFRSHYLKDLGRTRDQRILCSATWGTRQQPALPAPTETGADGVHVYRDLPLFLLDRAKVTTLQEGDVYVVLHPYIKSLRSRSGAHLQTTVLEASTNNTSSQSDPGFRQDSNFRIGSTLFATRCSLRYNTCMTTSLSMEEALAINRTHFREFLLSGILTGMLLGFLVSLAWQHSRGMERQLRSAIRGNTLRVVYQPVVDLKDGRMVGAEALARWTDDDGLSVSPEVFVKIAEDCGFIGDLTQLVIRRVLHDFGQTMREQAGFYVNVNVTATDLADPAFPDRIGAMLHQADVEPHSLGIEITESSSADQKTMLESIHTLRGKGHPVYIDDFGTGYSSLAYLKDLAVDAIKIDKTFTHAIGTEAVTAGILPQILSMAQALNLQVVAEGIETSEQAEFFSSANVSVQAQGWYFGFPYSSEEFHRLLAQNNQELASRACPSA